MFKRILVAVDGSETAAKALDLAMKMAAGDGARIRLVHVVEELAYAIGADGYGGYAGEFIKVIREAGEKLLKDAIGKVGAAGIEVESVLFDSFGQRIGETVANAARMWNADLVVVGTHGRRGVGRVLMGSGAEQIIRLAPVPVLVVRNTTEGEEA